MKVDTQNGLAQAALRVSLLYAVIAAVWILCSDKLLVSVVSDPAVIGRLATYKGWGFVAVTALLLYFTLRGQLQRLGKESSGRRRVEDELRWKTAFLEAQVDSALDGILVVDQQGKKILQNQRMNELWKFPRQIVENQDDTAQLQFATSRTKNPRQFAEKVAYLYSHPDEVSRDEIELVDGTVLDRYSSPVRDRDGKHYGRIWTFRDITERKRTGLALQQSEERFLQVTQTIGEVFWLSPPDFQTILYISPAFEKVWGRSCEELYAHPRLWLDAIHPEDVPHVLRALEELAQGRSYNIEFRIKRPDGTRRWINDRGYPQCDPDGKVILTSGVATDVTERKQTDESLRESEALYASLVEQMPVGIFRKDAKGCYVFANSHFFRITNTKPENFLGKSPREVPRTGATPLDDALRHHALIMQSGKPIEVEEVHVGTDGETRHIQTLKSAVFDSHGHIVGSQGILFDVTQRKRIETERQKLETQFRQSQKMEAFGQLASGVAHDFNNILTAIHGNASMLLVEELPSAERTDCVHQIVRAAERAAGLTRQLLLFSRKQAMQPANLDLTEVVGGMTKMLKRILGEDIALQTSFATDLPPMFGDAGMIEQVLLNLVVNSRDAMPRGGQLIITTGTERVDGKQALQNPDVTPGLHIWLAVSDTGCGIAPENLNRIFEPFFTTKEAGKGTGLGLATVYGIMQQHHGRILVTSETGKGTTFRACFPVATGTKVKGKSTPAGSPLPQGRETILIVEDDLAVRVLTAHLLQRCGYNTLSADSGPAALEIWREHKGQIQLLFTDMVMPGGLTGRKLAEQLSQEKNGLKVIYTSGYSLEFTKKELSLVEGVNFLQKPFSPLKVAEIVRAALNAK